MEKCGYKCEKCKAVDKMEKGFTIFRFPRIFVIHLKRFTKREKLTTSIQIPNIIDMTSYAPYSSHSSKNLAS
jgi:ubiquitin C-terminal hydrolase